MSIFNAEAFLNTPMTGQLDTKVEPCPPGEYRAQFKGHQFRSFTAESGETFNVMEVTWEILDEGVKATLQRDSVTSRQSIFLDVTEQGTLDLGKQKNIGLGQLLDAFGLNTGKPWTLAQLVGNMALVKVEPDKKDAQYTRVVKIAKMS